MENRIKEQQLGLFADRTSCQGWWANQVRLLLSSCAYVLLERLRVLALAGTELARAQVSTIRLKLLKIGAVVLAQHQVGAVAFKQQLSLSGDFRPSGQGAWQRLS
jgi:hypothetical protein